MNPVGSSALSCRCHGTRASLCCDGLVQCPEETSEEVNMKIIALAAALALVSASAFVSVSYAQTTCTAQAEAKKLAGAAKNSFMKKCETEATAACELDSKKQKLAGAAKNSHMKKCVSDRVGS